MHGFNPSHPCSLSTAFLERTYARCTVERNSLRALHQAAIVEWRWKLCAKQFPRSTSLRNAMRRSERSNRFVPAQFSWSDRRRRTLAAPGLQCWASGTTRRKLTKVLQC